MRCTALVLFVNSKKTFVLHVLCKRTEIEKAVFGLAMADVSMANERLRIYFNGQPIEFWLNKARLQLETINSCY